MRRPTRTPPIGVCRGCPLAVGQAAETGPQIVGQIVVGTPIKVGAGLFARPSTPTPY
ncbi:hypothetical protein [Herbidospora sp. RD11066]